MQQMGNRTNLLQGGVDQFRALLDSAPSSLVQTGSVAPQIGKVHLYRGKDLAQRVMKIARETSSFIVSDLEWSPAQAAHSALRSFEPSDVLDNGPHLRHHISIFRNREE